MNIKLTVSYEGSHYSGWQKQNNAITIEEKLRDALAEVGIEYTAFAASGRTDAGVHAVNQVVSFKSDTTIPVEKIALALNTKLPDDIVIIKSEEAEKGFHARKSALYKEYSYFINLNRIEDPFKKKYSWHFPLQIDPERLYQGMDALVGEHDFNAFKAANSSTKTSIRRITSITLTQLEDNYLRLDFVGNGFLYNMVRIMTGTLFQVSSGKLPAETYERVFDNPVRESAGITAPAKGLFLQNVFYTVDEFESYNALLLANREDYKKITFDSELNIL